MYQCMSMTPPLHDPVKGEWEGGKGKKIEEKKPKHLVWLVDFSCAMLPRRVTHA